MRHALVLLTVLALPGCGALTRLSEVGRPPEMTPSGDPTADAKYRPITMPMPRPQPVPAEANSLWRQGSRAFFKDQRASQVGDIVTILVNITDTADFQNASNESRTGTEGLGLPNMFGFEAALPRILSRAVNAKQLVSANSTETMGRAARWSTIAAGPIRWSARCQRMTHADPTPPWSRIAR